MRRAKVMTVVLFMQISGCGFPRPTDVLNEDAGGKSDTALDAMNPTAIIHVSPSGNDDNDGFANPVRTLKHALGLAGESAQFSIVAVASGTYSASSGETYPYTIPIGVTVIGPAGGGAVLAGSDGPGVSIESGTLQDLEFQDFAAAITVTGRVNLKNIRIRTNDLGIQVEGTGDVTLDSLDVTGGAGVCARGVVLNGAAKLAASNLSTRMLGTAFLAADHSTASLTGVMSSGDMNCKQSMFAVTSNNIVAMDRAILERGFEGIGFSSSDPNNPARGALSNVSFRDMDVSAFGGSHAVIDAVGLDISRTRQTSVSVIGGSLKMLNVSITSGMGVALYSQDTHLSMRNCTIVDNGVGVDLGSGAVGDLGTVEDPGNNTFKNSTQGLTLEGNNSSPVLAVGNTWKPVQGADLDGRYPSGTTITGPGCSNGNNFCILTAEVISL